MAWIGAGAVWCLELRVVVRETTQVNIIESHRANTNKPHRADVCCRRGRQSLRRLSRNKVSLSPFFFSIPAQETRWLRLLKNGEGCRKGGMTLEEEGEVVYTGCGSLQAMSGISALGVTPR